ncbi:flagellin [Pusillimonas minor]|uniref:Flagellin n=1 Tax=Pusillimonas minor TaxID=2697024 RepID=A0A842HVI5_9BURK|nr:flagellin [Pusillimonas minor]MBC2771191.1 flagellin FliC [Pusillimonas minor]
MSVINTNYLSLVAQNNLQKSQSALGTAIERLSSGLRINSAKDDAAGQAIANRMGAQINGLNQASRNANDGISAAQTTEGALNQINDNLQRIRVLTVQATNGTNSQEDLTSIQNEIGQRMEEIDRISRETEFNGVSVLAKDQKLTIQVGANDGQTIEIDLKEININKLKLDGFNVDKDGAVANKAATQADLDAASNIDKVDDQYFVTTANTAVTADEILSNIAETITVSVAGPADTNAFANALGFTTTGGTVALDGLRSDGNGGFKFDVEGTVLSTDVDDFIKPAAGTSTQATYSAGGVAHQILIESDGSITDTKGQAYFITTTGELTYDDLGGVNGGATVAKLTTAMRAATGADAASLKLENGTTVKNVTAGGNLTVENISISAADLADVIDTESLTVTTSTTAGRDGVAGVDAVVIAGTNIGTLTVEAGGNQVYRNDDGQLTQAEEEKVELFVRDNGNITDIAANQYFVKANGDITASATTPGGLTEKPLEAIDNALAMVDELRSDLGAIQNRFESAITNLQTTSNNLAAAQSRIQDADYSVEVANMTRAQILQQAGTSVLAQANQIPQGVLSLLR